MRFVDIYRMNKKAAEMLTPEAQAAAAQPPMPPPGAPPMDPAMMGAPAGAPMPPPSAPPMDPSMMGAGPSMPPPGAWMQDPMFMQLLQQSGVQIDPNTGMAMDPATGQPIPPEQLDQAYAMFVQQMMAQGGAGMPPPGAPPMDPAMMGAPAGAPPTDPAMSGMPPLGMSPKAGGLMPTPEDQANMIASIIMDSVNAVMDLKLAAVDKKISAFTDKLDSIKNMLDDLVLDKKISSQLNQSLSLNTLLLNLLRNVKPVLTMPKTAGYKPGNILSIMKRGM